MFFFSIKGCCKKFHACPCGAWESFNFFLQLVILVSLQLVQLWNFRELTLIDLGMWFEGLGEPQPLNMYVPTLLDLYVLRV